MKKILTFFLTAFLTLNTFSQSSDFMEKVFEIPGTVFYQSNNNFRQDITRRWSPYAASGKTVLVYDNNSKLNFMYPGEGVWYLRQDVPVAFKISAGKVVRVTFEAKKLSGDGSLCLMMSSKYRGEKLKDDMGHSPEINSLSNKTYKFFFRTDSSADEYYFRFKGNGAGEYEIYSIQADYFDESEMMSIKGFEPVTKNPDVFKDGKFEGPLQERPQMILGRGINCIAHPEGGQLISWRFLKADTEETCFTVSKKSGKKEKLLTKKPLLNSTNYYDYYGKSSDEYIVRSYTDSSMRIETGRFTVEGNSNPYKRISIEGTKVRRNGVGVGDLDGDGEYDYVFATTAETNIDPSKGSGWHASKEPVTLEAYTFYGEFLWKKCLGWNIESGIWYQPYVVCDLDGDGMAEVIAKTAENTEEGGTDYRNADGRVNSGPQYLSVLDGMTGEEITKVDWVHWKEFEGENEGHEVRNQISVAYLDGKTPCVLMLAGTYGHQEVRAYYLDNGKLVEIWKYNNRLLGPKYQGQGAHWTVCTDLDEDGRDEVIIGSVVLDDTGDILWTNGRGHPDAVYVGDIDPAHPGNEIVFFYETRQKDGGILMTDVNGNELWKLNEATSHVHSQGICGDIDPSIPGREIYAAHSLPHHQKDSRRWYYSADGTLLKKNEQINEKWGFNTVYGYVTDKYVESLFGLSEFRKNSKFKPEWEFLLVADLEGDWREEVFSSPKNVPNEVRIYSTVDETKIRHTAFMQDPYYSHVVTTTSSGYRQKPELIKN